MGQLVEVCGVKIGEGIPKICVPIVGRTKEEILTAAKQCLNAQIDFAEWRADWFDGVFDFLQVTEVLVQLREVLKELPLLFTFRTKNEGGEKAIEPLDYVQLNKKVIQTGLVNLVDAELFFGEENVKDIIAAAHQAHAAVIVSNHDFEKTPPKDEIIKRLCKMQELGADIPKIAVMPQNKKDVLTLLEATEEMTSVYAIRPIITMSMDKTGIISRLCGEIFGSAVTFGAAAKTSAPGQINAEQLRHVLEMIHYSVS